MRQPVDPTACAGCLDGGECWVCLGQGRFELARAVGVTCHACGGSGLCPLCETGFVRPVFLLRPA